MPRWRVHEQLIDRAATPCANVSGTQHRMAGYLENFAATDQTVERHDGLGCTLLVFEFDKPVAGALVVLPIDDNVTGSQRAVGLKHLGQIRVCQLRGQKIDLMILTQPPRDSAPLGHMTEEQGKSKLSHGEKLTRKSPREGGIDTEARTRHGHKKHRCSQWDRSTTW